MSISLELLSVRCTGDVWDPSTHLRKQSYPANTQLTRMETGSLAIEFWFYQLLEILKEAYLLSGNHAKWETCCTDHCSKSLIWQRRLQWLRKKSSDWELQQVAEKAATSSGLLDHTTVSYISSVYTVKGLEKGKPDLKCHSIPCKYSVC